MLGLLAHAAVAGFLRRTFGFTWPGVEDESPVVGEIGRVLPPATNWDVETSRMRVLSCEHFTTRKANVGDIVTCSFCGKESRVVKIKS